MSEPTFVATREWQDVPAGAILPPGLDIQMDMTTGRQQARLLADPGPPNGFEEVPPEELDATQKAAARGNDHDQDPPPPLTPCDLPAIDLARVFAPKPPPAARYIVDQLIPVGTSGLTSGPASGGKSFLELVKAVCLASAVPFLNLFPVEQCPVLIYNSEDPEEEIIRRLRKICEALAIDSYTLLQRRQLEIISTVGKPLALFETDTNNNTKPTDWFYRTLERAKHNKARYLSFDHIGR